MKKQTLLLGTAMAFTIAATPAAYAQEDQIIVTATKREKTLQETPVAVSVTSEKTIEQARILDISDLQSTVTSLRVSQLQSSQNTNFVIRGFGNGANNAGIEPSVGVFIDGVYRSRSAAQIGDLPKLSRIEVLRGPQSTLFGKNASAGVISIVTAKPSFENTGYVEAGYGNYSNITGKAYLSGAVSDSLAFSAGGSYNKRDGYNEAPAGLASVNDRNRWNLRGQLLFEPTENASFRVIADFTDMNENCCAVTNFQNQGAAFAIFAMGGQLPDSNNPFAYEAFHNKNSVNELQDYGVSVHGDVEFEKFTATSITSFRVNDSFFDTDADFGTLELLEGVSNDHLIRTFTQELRLTSNGGEAIDWMVGGYLFSEDVRQVGGLAFGQHLAPYVNILLEQATTIPGILTTLEGLYGAAPGTFLGDQVQTQETFHQDNTAWSVFGTADFNVTDSLTVTGGLNYTRDKKTVSSEVINNEPFSNIDLFNDPTLLGVPLPSVFFGQFFQLATGLAPTPANIAFIESIAPGTSAAIQAQVTALIGGIQGTQFQPQFVNFGNSVEDGKTDDDKVTWNIRANYRINDNINVYASASSGFKSSSWNLSRDSRPFATDAAALGAAGLLQANQTFGTRFALPEESLVYELGFKARFDRWALNMAVFDQSIRNFQSNVFLGTGFALSNAGEQSTKGMEVEFSITPVDPLTINVGATFLDPIYDDFTNSSAGDLTGTKPAGIPATSLSTSAVYSHDFTNGATGFLRGEWQYESEVQVVEDMATALTQPMRTVSTFNASAGVTLVNGMSAQLWARNLFNDEYFISAFPGVAQTGIINGYANAPRTFGVQLRKSW